MDIVSYLLGKNSSGGGGTTPTIGYTIDSWDEKGYPAEITTYGFTTLPNDYFRPYNISLGNSVNLTKVSLNDEITNIGEFAFWSNAKLKTINLPSSLVNIGESAFSLCSSLEITTLPNSVTTLGNSCFRRCTNIKKMSMGGVKTIPASTYGNSCFESCTGLKQVWIGSAITNAGLYRYSFYGCSNIEKMYIDLPRAIVEGFTNYQYAFSNNAVSTDLIVCNDDEDFITKEEFDALVVE